MSKEGTQTLHSVKTAKSGPIPCWQFFPEVLGITLTPAQAVLVKVCVDGLQLSQLSEEEQGLARELFGFGPDVKVTSAMRRRIIWLLGRGSGKSTVLGGIAIYLSLTLPLRRVGPGSVPIFAIIAANKQTAVDVTLSMVRAMLEQTSLVHYIQRQDADRVVLRRPDGKTVAIAAMAPSKGGKNVRGRDILGFMLDEAQFFNSDPDGRYAVNDRDVYGSLTPRLVEGAIGFFVSTPWPTENLMTELFEKNFSHPVHAIAARASTPFMRPDKKEELDRQIAEDMERDPNNTLREYFCDITNSFTGSFFDRSALDKSLTEEIQFLEPAIYPVACCIDLAFAKDSSTISIVQWTGQTFDLVHQEELIPKEGLPLKPSEVLSYFADIARSHGCRYVLSDGHYREAAKEAFQKAGITLVPLPEGLTGKNSQYLRAKAMLDEGKVRLPSGNQTTRKLLSQASAITARARGTGTISITSPRKMGQGHGDLVSSWVGALHHLSYAVVKNPVHRPLPGQPGHMEWLAERLKKKEEERERRYLKSLEDEVGKKNRWRFS